MFDNDVQESRPMEGGRRVGGAGDGEEKEGFGPGPEHPSTLTIMNNLGKVAAETQRPSN